MPTLQRERRYSRLHLFFAALGGALAALAAAALALWIILGPQALSLLEAWGAVRTVFVGEYDPERVVDDTLSGMMAGTGDRWSYYLNAEEYAAQNERRENSFVGIGVTVSARAGERVFFREVYPGGPAEKAGILVGEWLLAVNGTELDSPTQEELAALVLGEEGSEITLTVEGLDGIRREVTMRRARVESRSVEYSLLADGVGYIRVKNFYTHSGDQMKEAVSKLEEQGARALVFDMRNNGGGYVDELTEILDALLPAGPIFRSESKKGPERVTESDEEHISLPIATLVNGNTYSAAEFFAAQLQESAEAPIIGEKTSGKGYFQQAIPLPNGGALNLSTGRYRTGEGVSLIGTGVTLDAEVGLDEAQSAALAAGTLSPEEDPQLQKALEMLE